MKRTMISVVSAIIAGAICLAVTACNGTDSGLGDGIVSDVISAEEWEEALDEENFKNVKIENAIVMEMSSGGKINVQSVAVQDGDKGLINVVFTADGDVGQPEGVDSGTLDYYLDESGFYTKENGEDWKKEPQNTALSMFSVVFPNMFLLFQKIITTVLITMKSKADI